MITSGQTLVTALFGTFLVLAGTGENASAQDTELSIDQVPEEKQLQQDAKDKNLLSQDVPERCADPEIAAKDPECVPEKRQESVSESYGIPVIEDSSNPNSELLPGVTINQSRGSGR